MYTYVKHFLKKAEKIPPPIGGGFFEILKLQDQVSGITWGRKRKSEFFPPTTGAGAGEQLERARVRGNINAGEINFRGISAEAGANEQETQKSGWPHRNVEVTAGEPQPKNGDRKKADCSGAEKNRSDSGRNPNMQKGHHMEIDYYEMYGVEKPEETEETAETEEETQEAPENNAGEEGQEDAHPEEAPQSGNKRQSREENARFARERRQKERDAAIREAVEQERQKAKEEQDALIRGMGLENPYSGKPITSKAEYDEYMATHQQKQHESTLRQMGMDQTEYDQMIAGLPEVREARKVTEAAKKEAAEKQLRAELAEVAKWNPAIRTVEDLVKDPKYDQIQAYIDRNMTIPEAYQLAYMPEITSGKARQQTVNQMGKSHMASTVARGPGAKDIPMDVLQNFRRYLPDATPEDIIEFYRRHGG